MMDLIIYRELNLELNLVNYAILPLDENSGFVEMVQNAHTIYNIHEKRKFTIQNFIIEHNGSVPIEILRQRFVKSCAGYCVISYLLGIGDRHLDNIMITEDGYLFHIDYSFILGYDPKIITKNAFGSSEIRLTGDMIDMMGGMESKHYHTFKELCNKCYNCLRQHSNLFYILLNMLNNYRPEIDGKDAFHKRIIEKHIVEKFIPFENNYEAKIHINTKLSHTTHQSLGNTISDFFHYYNKEGWIGKMFRST
jgi:phosphatidylinositol 3-kinase